MNERIFQLGNFSHPFRVNLADYYAGFLSRKATVLTEDEARAVSSHRGGDRSVQLTYVLECAYNRLKAIP